MATRIHDDETDESDLHSEHDFELLPLEALLAWGKLSTVTHSPIGFN